jgi:hypothetical protein
MGVHTNPSMRKRKITDEKRPKAVARGPSVLFDPVVFSRVCDTLGADTLFELELVCRAFAAGCGALRMSGYLTGRVKASLRASGIPPFFDLALRADRAVVSGSSVLHAILGDTHWKPNDLDVFSEERKHNDYEERSCVHRALLRVQLDRSSTDPTSIPEKPYWNNAYDTHSFLDDPPIQSVCNYENAGPTLIQNVLVSVRHGGPAAYVTDRFCLAFLKNTFDGRRLVVHDKHAVRTRSARYALPKGVPPRPVHGPDPMREAWDRATVYTERGFSVEGIEREECFDGVTTRWPLVNYKIDGNTLVSWISFRDLCNTLQLTPEETLALKDEALGHLPKTNGVARTEQVNGGPGTLYLCLYQLDCVLNPLYTRGLMDGHTLMAARSRLRLLIDPFSGVCDYVHPVKLSMQWQEGNADE